MKEKIFVWQHVNTKEIAEIKHTSERISGKIAMDILKKYGEENEVTLLGKKEVEK